MCTEPSQRISLYIFFSSSPLSKSFFVYLTQSLKECQISELRFIFYFFVVNNWNKYKKYSNTVHFCPLVNFYLTLFIQYSYSFFTLNIILLFILIKVAVFCFKINGWIHKFFVSLILQMVLITSLGTPLKNEKLMSNQINIISIH